MKILAGLARHGLFLGAVGRPANLSFVVLVCNPLKEALLDAVIEDDDAVMAADCFAYGPQTTVQGTGTVRRFDEYLHRSG